MSHLDKYPDADIARAVKVLASARELISLKAARYEALAKSSPDPAQRAKYAANARTFRNSLSRVDGNPGPVSKAQAMKPVNDDLANETARRGLQAQAESEDRLAAIEDQRADEAQESQLRAPTDLSGYYSEKIREHRAHAELHRSRANAHRRAAAAF